MTKEIRSPNVESLAVVRSPLSSLGTRYSFGYRHSSFGFVKRVSGRVARDSSIAPRHLQFMGRLALAKSLPSQPEQRYPTTRDRCGTVSSRRQYALFTI